MTKAKAQPPEPYHTERARRALLELGVAATDHYAALIGIDGYPPQDIDTTLRRLTASALVLGNLMRMLVENDEALSVPSLVPSTGDTEHAGHRGGV